MNLDVKTVENEYHKNGTILETNRDLEFENIRKGSGDE